MESEQVRWARSYFGELADNRRTLRALQFTGLDMEGRWMPIGGAVRGWRRPIGTLLILTPLLVLTGLGLLGVLLGSMGMDIHWTSKAAFYVAMTCSIVLFCGCVMAGIRLRRSPKA
jgi:hypothetical protein